MNVVLIVNVVMDDRSVVRQLSELLDSKHVLIIQHVEVVFKFTTFRSC